MTTAQRIVNVMRAKPINAKPAPVVRHKPTVARQIVTLLSTKVGMARSYIQSRDTIEDDEGNLTTRTVISEKPRLLIRVLDTEGTITTLE
jgi:hypothetical protein